MIISLTGRARAGKDTVADYLVHEHGFIKMGFADPLRDMLYTLNPLVVQLGGEIGPLAPLVDKFGWEWVKDYTHDARPLLQRLGTDCIRSIEPDFWCVRMSERVMSMPYTFDTDIVIHDARFPNEAAWFSDFDMSSEVWRVVRPGTDGPSGHASEAGIPDELVARELVNDGSVVDLRRLACRALESARV